MSRRPFLPDGEIFGHYVVDGECVACGHKVGDLERFTTQRPPPETFYDESDLARLPEAVQRMMRRVSHERRNKF